MLANALDSGRERRASTDRVAIGYWSDPMCIWAFVAQEKLERLMRERGRCIELDYRIVPVFGSVPWRFVSGPWAKDGIEGRVAETRRIAERFGRKDVSGECWRRAAPSSSWAPAAAIEAVFAAEDEGVVRPGCGPKYQWALRERFFVYEANVALRSVQLAVAEEMDIPRAPVEARLDDGSALARVWEDYTEKERLRIQGSPTYVFDGGRAMLYGNFEYGMLRSTVDELIRGVRPEGSPC
jgi:predicted DsbA family dithiol-disulfide isomerase